LEVAHYGVAGFVEAWNQFLAAGKHVLVIDDVPRFPFDPLACAMTTKQQNDPCTFPASNAAAMSPLKRAAERIHDSRFTFVSIKEVFCDSSTCHSVIGGIPAYRDSGHIGAPFSRTMARGSNPICYPLRGTCPGERQHLTVTADRKIRNSQGRLSLEVGNRCRPI